MKTVAILGGLGSQMTKYAFYLDVKKKCQNECCYIDTTPFHTLQMWNGYELNRIFGIKEQDLCDLYSEQEKKQFEDVPYKKIAMKKMHDMEPDRALYCTNRGKVIKYGTEQNIGVRLKGKVQSFINQYWFEKVMHDDRHIDKYPSEYLSIDGNIYYDEFNHTSDFYFKDAAEEIRQAFIFPQFEDEKNKNIAKEMLETESVALHVRRSDHMYDNIALFERNYFKKSVDLIRQKAENLKFYVFSEETDWCSTHLEELGISNADDVCFIDWNHGEQSYRDMQLMTYCKHNILAISSFSWWGCYLSVNRENKIACAPNGYWFDIKNHF